MLTVELRKLRFDPERELPFEPRITAPTLQDVLKNPTEYLNKIPETERRNVFITLGRGNIPTINNGDPTRLWEEQSCFIFDIDKAFSTPDRSSWKSYRDALLAEWPWLREENFTIICSGHGLHIIFFLKEKIASKGFFDGNQLQYQTLTTRLQNRLTSMKLPGDLDPAVFKPNSMTRLPGSFNHKEGQQPVIVELLHLGITPIDKNLEEFSELKKYSDEIDHTFNKRTRTDNDTILLECLFLKHCQDQAKSLPEPLWQKMISITAKMTDGENLTHTLSKPHPGYREDQTNQKIRNTQALTGPGTCAAIGRAFPGCAECKHFGKITTPLQIKGKDFISNSETGYWIFTSQKGSKGPRVPAYLDLVRLYSKEKPFRTVLNRKTISQYAFNGTHWEYIPKQLAKSFCYETMEPKPNDVHMSEFAKILDVQNFTDISWFNQSTAGFVNFKNGVYEIKTKKLHPHSAEYGFFSTLPYDYDPNAKAPIFQKFLKKVTCDRADLATVILEAIGITLSGINPLLVQKVFIKKGDGSNGKTTTLEFLKAMFVPEDVYAGDFQALTQNEFQQAGLLNKKVIICEELPPDNSRKAWETVKAWAAGSETDVCFKGEDHFSIRVMAKMWFSTNHLGYSTIATYGLTRKLVILPFEALIRPTDADYDPLILDKLKTERSGVFNLAINAFDGFVARNYSLTYCKDIELENDEYKASIDPTGNFWDDYFELGEPSKHEIGVAGADPDFKGAVVETPAGIALSFDDIYGGYVLKTKASGEMPLKKSGLSQSLKRWLATHDGRETQLKSLGKDGFSCGNVTLTRTRVNGVRVRVILGLKFAQNDAVIKVGQQT